MISGCIAFLLFMQLFCDFQCGLEWMMSYITWHRSRVMKQSGLKAKLFIYLSIYIPTFITGPGALGSDQRMRSGIQVVEMCLLEVLFLHVERILFGSGCLEVLRSGSKLEETVWTVNTLEVLHFLHPW